MYILRISNQISPSLFSNIIDYVSTYELTIEPLTFIVLNYILKNLSTKAP